MKYYEECKYTTDDIDKIVAFKTWSDRKKIDTLFHIDCTQYCNMGIDSTIKEKQEVRTRSRSIYRAIKSIDADLGKLLLVSMD
jgi:hypothetical protein